MAKTDLDRYRLVNLARYIPELRPIIKHCPVFQSDRTDFTENDFLYVRNVGYALVRLNTYTFPIADKRANFRKRTFLKDPLEITAVLVTKRYKEKRPCLVLSHGSSGNTASEWQVAQRMMHKFDLNVLILDHYTQRGIKNTIANQFQLSIESQLIDLAEAKKFLENLCFVDRDRIFAVGVSRGGTVVDRLRRKKILKTLGITPFNAYICFYPLPHAQEIRPYLVSSPAFYMIGDQDDITPLNILQSYLKHLENFGYKSVLHIAEGAFHAFEYPGNWKLSFLNLLYNPTSSPWVNGGIHKIAQALLLPFGITPLHQLQSLKQSCYFHDERGFVPLEKFSESLLKKPAQERPVLPFSELMTYVQNRLSYGGRIKLGDEGTKQKAYTALYDFVDEIL